MSTNKMPARLTQQFKTAAASEEKEKRKMKEVTYVDPETMEKVEGLLIVEKLKPEDLNILSAAEKRTFFIYLDYLIHEKKWGNLIV